MRRTPSVRTLCVARLAAGHTDAVAVLHELGGPVRARCYRAAGGFPALAHGEDRALVAALARRTWREPGDGGRRPPAAAPER
ncbi:hypothetical protein [Streptomyces lydicus]|uniref:hypothetical protein n=1 Tax=Streptomyces lydicus TaxID=47763 RepID=UPI00343217D0